MARNRNFTEQDKDAMVNQYLDGDSTLTIGVRYGVADVTISRILKKRRVPIRPRTSYRALTPEQEKELVGRYESGERVVKLAKSYGICKSLVYNILDAHSITCRVQPITQGVADAIINLYTTDKLSGKKIAAVSSVTDISVYNVLRRRAIARRTPAENAPCEINHSAFDELTPDALYWLGFCFADAGTRRNQLTLALAIRDKAHVEKFRQFLGSTHKIGIRRERGAYKGGMAGSTGVASLNVTSSRIVERVRSLGLVNSRHAERIAAPELSCSPDFWRGMIDGDGWIVTGRKYHLGFCGNPLLVQQFRDFALLYCPQVCANVRPQGVIARFTLAGYAAHRMIDLLYDNDRVCLDRKKVKALQVLSSPRPMVKPHYGKRKGLQLKLL